MDRSVNAFVKEILERWINKMCPHIFITDEIGNLVVRADNKEEE